MSCSPAIFLCASSSTASVAGDVAQHISVDELHQVERTVVHRLVRAEGQRRCYRHVRVTQGRDHPVLARHVVRRGQDMADRRPPQDNLPPSALVTA